MELKATWRMAYLQNEEQKLSQFPQVNRDDIKKLASIGIVTVNQFLAATRMEQDRQEIARKSGAADETITELVKLCILTLLPGVAKIRDRLFYEAGLDS